MTTAGTAHDERRLSLHGWRLWLVSLLVPAAFLVVGLRTLGDYPETWDEQFDQDIGRFYLDDWSGSGVAGLEARFIPLQRYYGPFFDVAVVASKRLVHDRLGIVSSPVAAYHLPVLIVSSLGVWLVFWFGRRLWGTAEGLVASATLAVMPQFVAHSQDNLKDAPLAVFFTLSLFLLVEAVRRDRLLAFAGAGVAAGLTYAIKLHALFLAPIVLLWQLPEVRFDRRRWSRLLAGLAVTGAAGLATVLAAWPYYRHEPWLRFVETLRTFASHQYNEYVFYFGQHFRAHEVPWHFPFVMLGVNTPIVDLVFVAGALAVLIARIVRRRPCRSPLLLVALWLVVPPAIQSVSGAIKLDGIRHYLLVLPAVSLLVGFAMCATVTWVRRRAPYGRWLAGAGAAVMALATLAVVRQDVRLHPYQVVFFNRLAGGVAGARANFELDYWGVALAETAAWIDRNLPTGSRIWLTIPGEHFFKVDRSRFALVHGLDGRPNFKVNLIRGILRDHDTDDDYLHPRRKPVFAVTVAGADLVQVFEYPKFRDLPDGASLSPVRAAPGATEPGALVEETAGDHPGPPAGKPAVWTSLAFDCQDNAYTDRSVSLRVTGLLRVDEPGPATFEIASDDGAVLFLDGAAVLTNASGATSRRRLKLGAGVYGLQVDYRNEVGPACLRVAWIRPGTHVPEVVSAPWLMHESRSRATE